MKRMSRVERKRQIMRELRANMSERVKRDLYPVATERTIAKLVGMKPSSHFRGIMYELWNDLEVECTNINSPRSITGYIRYYWIKEHEFAVPEKLL